MTSVPGKRTGRVELTGLTGIRALAAGWVVVEHFRLVLYGLFPGTEAVLGPWIRSGFLGVEVFFVLSGFIIAYTYADRFAAFSGAGYRAFLELRFARIYPMHLVTLLAMLALVLGARALGVALSADGGYTPLSFAANLLNAQAVLDLPAWNGPAWSISAEFAAYLAFPLVAVGLVRLRTATAGFVAAGLLVVVGAAAMLAAGALVIDSPTGFLLIWLRIGFEFTAGCCLYGGWRRLDGRRFGWRWDATAALSVLALGVALEFVGVEGTQPLVTLPVIALFVLACAGATGPVGRLLGSRLLLWGGRISYSVYMTHFIVLMVLGVLLPVARFADAGTGVKLAVLVGCYAVVVVVGAACYHLVEEPSRKTIRALIARRSRRAAVSV
ncbi:acyltransferase family protein [Clavibacter michiganensis]|uniref:acyltransferase family protein n=1 Tax=Clavibacter michiganensis TaxID=28447 RepID=UPI001BE071A7|nr:acyltransferase [Clavibacter michiganensis]MBT1636349.1 acyltransferase [Clavibacter michiganensis]